MPGVNSGSERALSSQSFEAHKAMSGQSRGLRCNIPERSVELQRDFVGASFGLGSSLCEASDNVGYIMVYYTIGNPPKVLVII